MIRQKRSLVFELFLIFTTAKKFRQPVEAAVVYGRQVMSAVVLMAASYDKRLHESHSARQKFFALLPASVVDGPRRQLPNQRIPTFPQWEASVRVLGLVEVAEIFKRHVGSGRPSHRRVYESTVGTVVGERDTEGYHLLLASGELRRDHGDSRSAIVERRFRSSYMHQSSRPDELAYRKWFGLYMTLMQTCSL